MILHKFNHNIRKSVVRNNMERETDRIVEECQQDIRNAVETATKEAVRLNETIVRNGFTIKIQKATTRKSQQYAS